MNNFLNIKLKSDVKLLCISDIHEHPDQFFSILDKYPVSDKMILIVCGDVIDKGFGSKSAEKIYKKIYDLNKKNQAFMIKGNHEIKLLKYNKKINNFQLLKWIDSLPISLSFIYPNLSRYTFVHGGVDPQMNWDELSYDLSVCYIRYISNKSNKMASVSKKEENGEIHYIPKDVDVSLWHDVYDGRFGYIISGHNNDPGGPRFYNYSCNIDTGVFTSGKITAIIIGEKGREEVYQSSGPAFKKTNV